MKSAIAIALALSVSACATTGSMTPQERCDSLASKYQVYGAVAAAASVLAGSGALTTPLPDDRDLQLGMGIASAGMVAVAAAAKFVQEDVGGLYNDACAEEPEPVATSTTASLGRWLPLVGLLVAAHDPQPDPNPMLKAKSLGQASNITTQIDAANTECLTSSGGGSTCGLYAMGSVTPVQVSTADATVCVSQRRLRTTIGAQAAETAGNITADGMTENCSGWTFLAAGLPHDIIPDYRNLREKTPYDSSVPGQWAPGPTYSGRYCTLTARGVGGQQVHPPCGFGLQTQLIVVPASPTNSATYNVVINGTNVAAATDGSATQAELRDALVTAINGSAQASVVTAATATNDVLVTSDVGGLVFTFALGSQPATPLTVGTAVSAQSADNTECVTMSGTGSVCIVRGDARNAQYEAEGTASAYFHARPGTNATRFVAATER